MGEEKVVYFERLLEKKKKSDALPRAELEGKYKKAYEGLKQEICQKLGELLPHFILSGMVFKKNDIEAGILCQQAQEMMNREMRSGMAIKLRDIAYEKYNLSDILCEAVPLHNKIIYHVYSQYWIDNCSPVTAPGFSYYNHIVDMWYHAETKQWMRQSDDGKVEYTTYYPPTRKGFDEEYHSRCKAL